MGDPARGEESGSRLPEVRWIEVRGAEEIAHVIERHDHHDGPAQEIHGVEPVLLSHVRSFYQAGTFGAERFARRSPHATSASDDGRGETQAKDRNRAAHT